MAVNYPRLYVNGAFSRILKPINATITEKITPLSSASLTLQKDESIPVRSWVEMFTPYGSAGMYRVRAPHNAYGGDVNTVELEHMISEVGDYLVKEKFEEMVEATTAMKKVFSHYKGGKWKLGDVSALGTGKISLQGEYNRVLDSMLSILSQKPDCYMTFNFKTTPWTVGVKKRETDVTAEGRLARNVSSATVSYDDSELVTRVWYQTYKKVNGKMEGTWVSKDASTKSKYGVIEGTVSTSSDMTATEINYTVNTYISEHKEPRVNVKIRANELSKITGESMDKFTIGKMFRLALPDYNVTVEKNITEIVWNAPYSNPRDVQITLGDEEDTVVTFLHNLDSKGSGGGGGGKAKKAEEEKWKEYYTEFERTDEVIRMTATKVDRANNILEQAGMSLNSKGVIIYAHDNTKNVMSYINTQADRISLIVSGSGPNAKIKPASIVASINNGSSSIKISADHVVLDGYVTASMLSSAFTSAQQISTQQMTISQYFTCLGYNTTWKSLSVGTSITVNSTGGSVTGVTLNKTTMYYLGR